jgi:hypothetical protein
MKPIELWPAVTDAVASKSSSIVIPDLAASIIAFDTSCSDRRRTAIANHVLAK